MQRSLVALCGLLGAACGGSESATAPFSSTHPGEWTCVGRGAAEGPLAAVHPPVDRFAVALQDAYTHAPVADLRLAVCARSDEDCADADSQGTADRSGAATLTAPGRVSSFDGFLRVSGPGFATHYVFLGGRRGACASCALVLPLYTPAALEATARMTGVTLDARGGMVRTDLEDCAGAPAQGVSLSIGSFGCSELGATKGLVRTGFPFGPEGCAGPLVAYATGGHGDVTRAALTTDATGVALGFGVPPGPLAVVELLDGKTVAGALGFVRAGAVSEFVLRP